MTKQKKYFRLVSGKTRAKENRQKRLNHADSDNYAMTHHRKFNNMLCASGKYSA